MKANLLTVFLTVSLATLAQPRQETILTDDWSFSRDQQTWQTVRVPHDWAIAGPFDKKWDLQNVAIEQNGETEATEKSGRSGALPWIGEGYYKRTITIPEGCTHAELLFDGAMAEPKVYLNGELVREPKLLQLGDRISMGNCVFEFVPFCRDGHVWEVEDEWENQ